MQNGLQFCLQIVFWKRDEPENQRVHFVASGSFEPCPLVRRAARAKRQAGQTVDGHVLNLWPYSDISAGVLVKNSKYSGELSDPPIECRTPEGGTYKEVHLNQSDKEKVGEEWRDPKWTRFIWLCELHFPLACLDVAVPGAVNFFEVEERGSHHFVVSWGPPAEPNGVLLGYTIGYRPGQFPSQSGSRCCSKVT